MRPALFSHLHTPPVAMHISIHIRNAFGYETPSAIIYAGPKLLCLSNLHDSTSSFYEKHLTVQMQIYNYCKSQKSQRHTAMSISMTLTGFSSLSWNFVKSLIMFEALKRIATVEIIVMRIAEPDSN